MRKQKTDRQDAQLLLRLMSTHPGVGPLTALAFELVNPNGTILLGYMAIKHQPEEFARDLEARQRNIVFPDTARERIVDEIGRGC